MEDLTVDELAMEFSTCYFPPTQRDRIEKQLATAGKLEKRKKSSLEIIQGLFAQEAHILNKTVIVDDNTERKIYTPFVFQNVKRYNCNVCVSAVYGKMALIQHNQSRKHYEMCQRTSHPHQNFDDNRVVNLEPEMKTISMSDCYIGEFLDQCKKSGIHHVLIGLEYLVEVVNYQPYYHCLLCDKVAEDIGNVIDHLQSAEHRFLYLLLFFPKVYKKLVLIENYTRKIQLNIVVINIENKFGRLRPWRHEGSLSLKQKRAIRYSMDSGPHIRDNPELSFAEDIPFNNELKNLRVINVVLTEFVVDESESSVLEYYERLKGGVYKCRLCRIVVESPLERITHPYTGRHLEKTIKGIAIYDSVPCQITRLLNTYPQPLIGSEYIVEYDEQGASLYYCMLCRKAMNNHDMVLSHLVSKSHRQRYIKHHMPRKDEELLKLSGPMRAEEIEKLLKLIEAKCGRLPPFGCLFSLDHQVDSKRTVKDLISEKIMDGRHLTIDEWDIPKVIFKMPVPLFPKESLVLSEVVSKKRKRNNQWSLSPGKRSTSPESLSAASTQRRLSPEPRPGPSTRILPQESIPPSLAVQDWLENINDDPEEDANLTDLMSMVQMDRDYAKSFFLTVDLDNWENVDHKCCPFLDIDCPLKTKLGDDSFLTFRECFTKSWLREKLSQGGRSLSIDINNERRLISILSYARYCVTNTSTNYTTICRPLCRNLVLSLRECILDDFQKEDEQVSEEDLKICAVGLAAQSYWFELIWSHLPRHVTEEHKQNISIM